MYTIMTYTEILINLYIGIYVENQTYIANVEQMYKYNLFLEESHTKTNILQF